jgi:putative protein-disulfide isomerase
MGGLLPDWNNYNDPTNSITRPIQMGPMWMHASQLSGMSIESRIWMEDPPASSYPACVAVKCAQMQSKEAGEIYLRMLREAVMIRRQNIAKQEVLIDVAEEVQKHVDFSVDQFKNDLGSNEAIEAFRKDLQEIKYKNIERFPTLIFRRIGQPSAIITGYRSYETILQVMETMAPGISDKRIPITDNTYQSNGINLTERELKEFGLS